MQKKGFGAPQKPRISRLLKLIILIVLIELNIICSLFLARDVIWASRAEVSPFKFLKYFSDFYAPIYAISLVYTASQTKSRWKNMFHWKVWCAPALAGIIFSLSQWRFNPINDYNTQIFPPNTGWLPRLATYPFFLTLSFFAGPTAQSNNTQNKS